MHSDRQNVGEHDQEVGNVYIEPASVFCRPSSVVRRLSSGFTLVELLVVVAIIAVMLMLLLPNVRNMRERAWSVACQNNLHQYGVAMKQYMSSGSDMGGSDAKNWGYNTDKSRYTGGILIRPNTSGVSAVSTSLGPPVFKSIINSLPQDVTIQSLSDGQSSVRVCPVVLQHIKRDGNFFDPNSPNFKGEQDGSDDSVSADFEVGLVTNQDGTSSLYLSQYFSTYAVNSLYGDGTHRIQDIPENVVAYIDFNAWDGWGGQLQNTTWQFNGTNSQGVAVVQNSPKWTNAWWLTEVGFNHRIGKEYGANYVAMDGHVAWISSNTISITNFSTGL